MSDLVISVLAITSLVINSLALTSLVISGVVEQIWRLPCCPENPDLSMC
jgi:hypothetical protein